MANDGIYTNKVNGFLHFSFLLDSEGVGDRSVVVYGTNLMPVTSWFDVAGGKINFSTIG